MKHLFLPPLFLFGCSDWPTKDSQENEENPININITIENDLNNTPDNNTQEVDVDSNSDSNSDSSSESTIDNSTGIQVYEFNSIL